MNKNNSRFSIIVVKKTKESPNSQELKFLSNPKSLIFYKSQLEIKPLCNQWKSDRVKRKQKVKEKKKTYLYLDGLNRWSVQILQVLLNLKLLNWTTTIAPVTGGGADGGSASTSKRNQQNQQAEA